MTSPGIGSASVDIVAEVDEQKLANGARRAGQRGGETAADSFGRSFRRRVTNNTRLLFSANSLRSVFVRGARQSGNTFAQNFTDAVRRGLSTRGGKRGIPSVLNTLLAGAGGGVRGVARISEALGAGLRKIAHLGRLTKIILGVTIAAVALVPALGNVYNGLLEIAGVVVGLPALLLAVGAAFGVLRAGAKGLEYAVAPVRAAFFNFDRDVSRIFSRLRPIFDDFARKEIPQIRRALTGLAVPLAALIGRFVTEFGGLGGGDQIAGFIDNLSRAFLILGRAANPILRILLQLITQVGARLPELSDRFSQFMERLAGRASRVDFGQVFVTAVNGIVNLGAALVTVIKILREFFKAAAGQETRSDQPFAGLRAFLDDLLITVRENKAEIRQFFVDFFTVLRILGQIIVTLLPILQFFLDKIRALVQYLEAHPRVFDALVKGLVALFIIRTITPLLLGLSRALFGVSLAAPGAAGGIGAVSRVATLALSPLGRLLLAIGAVIAAFYTLKSLAGMIGDISVGSGSGSGKNGEQGYDLLDPRRGGDPVLREGRGKYDTRFKVGDPLPERDSRRDKAQQKDMQDRMKRNAEAQFNPFGSTGAFDKFFDAQKAGVGGAKDAVQAASEATTKALEKQRDAIARQIEVLEAFRDKMRDFFTSVIDQVKSFVTITSLAPSPENATAGGIIKSLQDRVKAIALMTKNLALLEKRGLDRGVLAELAQAGPESRGIVSALAKATPAQIAALNAAERQARGLASTLATQARERQFGAGVFAKNQKALDEQNRRLANIERLLEAQPALLSKALKNAEKTGTLVSGGRVVA